jgi:hypothetical protein
MIEHLIAAAGFFIADRPGAATVFADFAADDPATSLF